MSLKRFIEYYIKLGKKIARPYYYLLKGFRGWLQDRGKNLNNFTANDVEEYMAELAKKSPRSANLFLSAVRKYAEWRARNALRNEDFIMEERRVWSLKGIRMIKVAREIKKEALSADEIKRLLEATSLTPKLFIASVVHFYYGWRPVEGAKFITDAKIFWNDNYMIIKTAKVGNERILPWAPQLTPIIQAWHDFARTVLSKMARPQEWYTKAIKPVGKRLNLQVTARTTRKTFETHMRRAGVDQWAINFLLGHTTSIPDVYTDWDELKDYLTDIMTNRHFLLPILDEVLEEVADGWTKRMKT